MAITNCPNGHYYDNSLFSECPYCKKNGQQSQSYGGTEFAEAMFGANGSNNNVQYKKTRIVSPDNSPVQTDPGKNGPKTQMYYDVKKYTTDPIAGWLVCVSGVDKGKDFYITTEKTLIGRSGSSAYKIELSDDKISRNSAVAVIAYLQETRSCIISPVPGGNLLISVNNKIIQSPVTLNDNDKIQIGDTLLVFISFCNQHFDWDAYQVKYPPKL